MTTNEVKELLLKLSDALLDMDIHPPSEDKFFKEVQEKLKTRQMIEELEKQGYIVQKNWS